MTGSGTTSLTITGSLAQVNADLGTLTDTDARPRSDTITLNASDSFGNSATPQTIAVTVTGCAGDHGAGARRRRCQGTSTAIAGVSLSESGNTARRDLHGDADATPMAMLSATGAGVVRLGHAPA